MKKVKEQSTEPKRNVLGEKLIADQVIGVLGIPDHFTRVTARNVFDNSYRVNVWARESAAHASEHIVDSFFIVATEDNRIKNSSPDLENKYITKKTDMKCRGK
jgi:hypothetical protein